MTANANALSKWFVEWLTNRHEFVLKFDIRSDKIRTEIPQTIFSRKWITAQCQGIAWLNKNDWLEIFNVWAIDQCWAHKLNVVINPRSVQKHQICGTSQRVNTPSAVSEHSGNATTRCDDSPLSFRLILIPVRTIFLVCCRFRSIFISIFGCRSILVLFCWNSSNIGIPLECLSHSVSRCLACQCACAMLAVAPRMYHSFASSFSITIIPLAILMIFFYFPGFCI